MFSFKRREDVCGTKEGAKTRVSRDETQQIIAWKLPQEINLSKLYNCIIVITQTQLDSHF